MTSFRLLNVMKTVNRDETGILKVLTKKGAFKKALGDPLARAGQ